MDNCEGLICEEHNRASMEIQGNQRMEIGINGRLTIQKLKRRQAIKSRRGQLINGESSHAKIINPKVQRMILLD